MKILALQKSSYRVFKQLFCDYYTELESDEDLEHLLKEYVLPDYEAELIQIALAFEDAADGDKNAAGDNQAANNSQAVGFVIYQIDSIENDWCIHEGWGDIRELYVKKEWRNRGIGKSLLAFAERELEGLPLFVLPDEACESFFVKAGFKDSGEMESETACKIFVKNI